ncbi:MAG: hypothetical protein A4E52_00741 [Pelotomaculum sp. PtaB.Bin013]|nr:MAG: hypothetical protein A4E52_00741 [Pelotomaculum sp. PtaB.Bin013]
MGGVQAWEIPPGRAEFPRVKMLVFNFKKFLEGLKALKERSPISDAEKEMRKVLMMIDSDEPIDYGSFNTETVQQLLENYYYQDNEDGIERDLVNASFIAERTKMIPPRRTQDVFFL